MVQRVRQVVGKKRTPGGGGAAEALVLDQVLAAAAQGDRAVLATLEEVGRYLGIGIANLINALNPQRVVFGGILSLAHAFLLPEIRACVEARALRWAREATSIVIATHGQDACVMGGVAMVYHNVLARPREVRPRLAAPAALAQSGSLPGAPAP
jgi:predicted NBD/HSP70 family sugar kinase